MSVGTFILLILVITLVMGVPIAISIGFTSLGYFLFTGQTGQLLMLAQKTFSGMNSFELMAIPMFVLAGDLMFEGKISDALVNFAKSLVGWIRGSMSIVTTLACMLFGAVSGSGPATASAIGSVVAPSLKEDGYPSDFSACCIAAAGPLGSLIPPSITAVVYGVTVGVSVGDLLLAGVYPGIVFGLALMVYQVWVCTHNKYGKIYKFNLKTVGRSFIGAIPALLCPIIILGGIYSGKFTPTEAGAIACLYALLVGMFYYKRIKWKDMPRLLAKSAVMAASILLIIGCISCFSYVLTREKINEAIAVWMISHMSEAWQFILACNLIYLLAGMIENGSSAIILLAPILHPIALQYGIDPVFFGAMTVANLAIGMCTPPMAATLYIAARICNVNITQMCKRILPFLGVLLIALAIVCLTPDAVTFLPYLFK